MAKYVLQIPVKERILSCTWQLVWQRYIINQNYILTKDKEMGYSLIMMDYSIIAKIKCRSCTKMSNVFTARLNDTQLLKVIWLSVQQALFCIVLFKPLASCQ